MRKSFRGCPPYEGEEPYLFLCFSEEDRNAVFPLLERLYSRGCRIWYSLKNTSKQEEMNRQQERIRNAAMAVLFLTDHVRRSRSVKGSLMYYQKQGKPVICIDTDDGDRMLSVGLSTEAIHLDGRNGKPAEELETELIHTEGFTQQLIGDPRFLDKNRQKKTAAALLAVALVIAGTAWYGYTKLGWGAQEIPAETPTTIPSGTPSQSPAPTAEPTREPTPEPTAPPTPTPTASPEPTAEPTPEPTPEPTATPEPTPTPIPDEVFFSDAELTAAVREAAGGGAITLETASGITELRVSRVPEDPTELAQLPNLERLLIPQDAGKSAADLLDTGITVVLLPEGVAVP